MLSNKINKILNPGLTTNLKMEDGTGLFLQPWACMWLMTID